MKSLLILLSLLLALNLSAQKNLVLVSNSTITGIALPQGSKPDKPMMFRLASKTNKDMESKDSALLCRVPS